MSSVKSVKIKVNVFPDEVVVLFEWEDGDNEIVDMLRYSKGSLEQVLGECIIKDETYLREIFGGSYRVKISREVPFGEKNKIPVKMARAIWDSLYELGPINE